MNTNELKALLNDLYGHIEDINKQITKAIDLDDSEAMEILEDLWHSINNRIEDVEERIARKKVRKITNPTEKLMSENVD